MSETGGAPLRRSDQRQRMARPFRDRWIGLDPRADAACIVDEQSATERTAARRVRTAVILQARPGIERDRAPGSARRAEAPILAVIAGGVPAARPHIPRPHDRAALSWKQRPDAVCQRE